jgi:carboxypeptidase PM20D1
MTKLLAILTAALVLLVGFSGVLTARYVSSQTPPTPAREVRVPAGAADRLAGAIRLQTVSAGEPTTFDGEAFRTFHLYLEKAFPLVHSRLRREVVGSYSLLYTWNGTDAAADPILLIGHMDVVPIESGTEKHWTHDPFGGQIANGFIWGRGAIDNKSAVLGTLEAVELLLAEGFSPSRTVFLAFGHDEEIGGGGGAREIAALLKRRGAAPEMVLDEGGVIADGVLSGIHAPVALVGIAEKGFVTIELTARTAGGHSSLAPSQSAIGMVSAAITKLEGNPMPARLDGPTRQMFDHIGREYPGLQRVLFANLWLTRPMVIRTLQKNPATNAMVRTTTAATIFQAGSKDNILPTLARAVINVRILPGDSIRAVTEHVTRVVDDNRIAIAVGGRFAAEPSHVSRTDSEAFQTLQRTIRSIVPHALVTPYLVSVVTDARHYDELSENVFRFLPLTLNPNDLERIHGIDERLEIREYENAIRVYRQLVVNAAG